MLCADLPVGELVGDVVGNMVVGEEVGEAVLLAHAIAGILRVERIKENGFQKKNLYSRTCTCQQNHRMRTLDIISACPTRCMPLFLDSLFRTNTVH